MITFTGRATLKNKYLVKGSFYMASGNYCRNYADILSVKHTDRLSIDAYFICMNPGSCQPTGGWGQIHASNNAPHQALYMTANSDKLQQTIMQIMDVMKYKKVRILNLLDLCEPKSAKIKQILTVNNFATNISIFSDARKAELKALTMDKAPYIVAWGTNHSLKGYSELAKQFLFEHKKDFYGVKNKAGEYYYLMPRCKYTLEKQIMESIVNYLKQ